MDPYCATVSLQPHFKCTVPVVPLKLVFKRLSSTRERSSSVAAPAVRPLACIANAIAVTASYAYCHQPERVMEHAGQGS